MARTLTRRAAVLSLFALALPVGPAETSAQESGGATGGFWSQLETDLLVYGQAAIPTGEFGDLVRLGGGAGFATVLSLSGSPRFGLRIEGAASGFRSGRSGRGYRAGGYGESSMFAAGIGPQIHLATGRLRPYLYGTWGGARFTSESEYWDDDRLGGFWFGDGFRGRGRWFDNDRSSRRFDDDWFDWDDEFDDTTFFLGGGVGVAFDVYRGGMPVALDVSVSYRHYGTVRLAGAGPAMDLDGFMAMAQRYLDALGDRFPGSLDFPDFVAPSRAANTSVNLVNASFGVSVGIF